MNFAFVVAAYSSLLLAGLADYGPKRGEEYRVLPKWRRNAKRPSCQDLVTLPDPRLTPEKLSAYAWFWDSLAQANFRGKESSIHTRTDDPNRRRLIYRGRATAARSNYGQTPDWGQSPNKTSMTSTRAGSQLPSPHTSSLVALSGTTRRSPPIQARPHSDLITPVTLRRFGRRDCSAMGIGWRIA